MVNTVKLGLAHKKLAYDKQTPPVAQIKSGSIVTFETEDRFYGLGPGASQDKKASLGLPASPGGCCPVTGPLFVEDAREGDCLAVEILSVSVGEQGHATLISGAGLLEDVWGTFQRPLDSQARICLPGETTVRLSARGGAGCFELPVKPFVGAVGVAPKYDRRSSFCQGLEWCGNVGLPEIGTGATVILPVNAEGGLLYLGGMAACQGDGGITGCALECRGRVEARITRLSREEAGFVKCPQVNTSQWIGSIGLPVSSDLTAAMKQGYVDLARRMERKYGIPQEEGYLLLGLAGKARIGNEMACLCRIDRSVLERHI